MSDDSPAKPANEEKKRAPARRSLGLRVALGVIKGLVALGVVVAVVLGASWLNVMPGGWRVRSEWTQRKLDAQRKAFRDESTKIPEGSVVFLGSSTVAKMPMAELYKGAIVVNRGVGAENTLAILLHSTGALYGYCWGSGTGTAGTVYAMTWTAAHRVVVTYEHGAAGATKRFKLYVDGVLRQTNTSTNALLATKTQASALGLAGDIYSTGALAGMVVSDAQVWGSLLTAAQVTADWRQVRGALL